jgi:3-hydroxyisobutyrate dehydrogenase-like beta-hydroxyacid dehydrogenase
MTRGAVVGLGAMGSRIARRLLGAGHDVVVWNRTPARLKQSIDLGADAATDPADATRRADIVIIMVSDGAALRDVTEGPKGVASGAGDSTTVIQMSTVGLAPMSRLASILPAGTGLLDAPVLGSVSEAESGTLTIFVGGPPPLVERWTPLLSVLGSPVRVGDLGGGTAAKLVANATLFGILGVLGEALALAGRLDLAPDVAFQVLAATPLAAQAERRRRSIETGDYPARFSLSLARKDADLILDAAADRGVDLRILAAARTWLAEAEEAGRGDRDYSGVLAHILESGR